MQNSLENDVIIDEKPGFLSDRNLKKDKLEDNFKLVNKSVSEKIINKNERT